MIFANVLFPRCRPERVVALLKEFKIKLMERMLGAKLTAHLGYEEGKEAPPGQTARSTATSSAPVSKGCRSPH